jgi:tripartite-type tricarboxylate transporter receptor subunit TctC
MKVKMKVQESLIRLFLTLASTVILGTNGLQAAPANLSLIVSASPGTGLDILARTLSQQFSIKGNYATVVENKAGASGNIAADHVTRAKPDGATLLVVGTTFATKLRSIPTCPLTPSKIFRQWLC